MVAIVVAVDGSRAARAETHGPIADAERIGIDAAEQLLARGAADILADVEQAHGAVEGIQP
jgi:hydroxymethylbilane synthase